MRIRTKRRRLLLLSKFFIIIACSFGVYFFIHSISYKPLEQIKVKQGPKIFIVENDIDIWDVWENMTSTDTALRVPGRLIGLNSHCNDGLYLRWHKNITNIYNAIDAQMNLVSVPLQAVYPAVAGLFQGITCIYPWWRNSSDIYVHQTHYLGVWQESLCLCTTESNATQLNKSMCRLVHSGYQMSVSASHCLSLSEHWQTFTMQDIYAQTGLKDVSATEPTMVNIDLDFFTVDQVTTLPGRDIISDIEAHINTILCPVGIQDETLIDVWFQDILTMTASTSLRNMEALLLKYKLPMCSHKRTNIKGQLNSLSAIINSLPKNQRAQLSSTGLCVLHTPSTYRQIETLSLAVCTSQIDRAPHTASDNEISLQIEKLVQFLKQSVKEPRLIAIVRSTRVGFVSPQHQAHLESLILNKLQSIYQLNDTDVVYHPNLLGGPHGWATRHIPSSGSLH